MTYRYPRQKKRFKLKEVKGFIYFFECGHWVTDNVFQDLINCKTGLPNYLNNQLQLFTNDTTTKKAIN
jgi:hypothetical protein